MILLLQTGLPAYPVSPNISPISQRSDRVVYQSIDTQVKWARTQQKGCLTNEVPKIRTVEFENSGDPDEVVHHNEPPHLDLQSGSTVFSH